MIRKPQILLLSLAVTAVLAGCAKPNEAAAPAAATAAAPAAPATLTLDESKLPAANRFLMADLDTSKNACTDFTGFANGKWLAANAIPSDRTTWGSFEMLGERSTAIQRQLVEQAAADKNASGVEKIVGDLWATGMDEAKINAQGIDPIKADLAAIDGLKDKEGIVAYLRSAAAKGQNGLFGFGANADFKDSSKNIAYAMQGGLALPDPEYYSSPANKKELDAYQAHIAKVLELAGASAADAAQQAKDVIAFETRLAKVSKTSTELSRNTELFYNPVTVAEADALTPNFSWTEFFKSQGIAPQEKFSLAIPAFHQEVSKMLGDTDPAVWRNYLRFHTIDSTSPYLSDAFANEHFNFYNKTLRGQQEIKPRWKRVLDSVEDQAGEALGQMYVKVAFPEESKAKMETLVGNLRTAMKGRIENLAWMSDETKQKAIAKWETFTPKIGYPDKWREWTGLATSRDSYVENLLAAQEYNYKFNISKIGKAVDKTEWGMSPQTVNAYYNPQQNEIVFPAAILQPPFFDANATDEMNYGGIGAVIGHEMSHGYDDQGARFGPTGNFEEWWTDADKKSFQALTGKLVDQFNQYSTSAGGKVSGELTLGENIADLGGLNIAYAAMKKATEGTPDPMIDGMTRDQRFFLNWATVWRRNFQPQELAVRLKTDPHAPANFRAIGTPSNMPEFAAAFKCKVGDAMVRAADKQVVIW